jgi:hypothetical protein
MSGTQDWCPESLSILLGLDFTTTMPIVHYLEEILREFKKLGGWRYLPVKK